MLLPWVPEVFSRVRRGASFRRPQANTCSGPKPETAHGKPLEPRVICYRIVSLKLVPTIFGTICRKSLYVVFNNSKNTTSKFPELIVSKFQFLTDLWLSKDSVDPQNMVKHFIEQHQRYIQLLFIKHL